MRKELIEFLQNEKPEIEDIADTLKVLIRQTYFITDDNYAIDTLSGEIIKKKIDRRAK